MSAWINEFGQVEGDNKKDMDELWLKECFKCWLCNAPLVKRTIIVNKDSHKTLEMCEQGHFREEK